MKKTHHLHILPVAVSLVLFFLAGCITEPDLSSYPTVSFKNEVQPIISGNCGTAGCHGLVDAEECYLVTYNDIRFQVEAGDARKSNLYRYITGREEEIMPPSPASMLTNEQIGKIYLWIEQGALDN
jgi:hypothetical protein